MTRTRITIDDETDIVGMDKIYSESQQEGLIYPSGGADLMRLFRQWAEQRDRCIDTYGRRVAPHEDNAATELGHQIQQLQQRIEKKNAAGNKLIEQINSRRQHLSTLANEIDELRAELSKLVATDSLRDRCFTRDLL